MRPPLWFESLTRATISATWISGGGPDIGGRFKRRAQARGPMSKARLLHLLIKVAAIFFVVGLLIFALAVGAYVLGLSAATRFVDQYTPVADAAKISDQALNSGIDGLMALVFSLFGAVLSWGCFFIGIAIGLYALIQV